MSTKFLKITFLISISTAEPLPKSIEEIILNLSTSEEKT
jgi:hypothetical protein